jgi:hypothetical protein
MTRLQQLMDRVMKGDQSVLPEIDKLKEELDKQQAVEAEAEKKSVVYATNVPGSFVARARWIVAAKKGDRISKIVVIFPIPEIQRTIIKEIWDLSDYPSAWPKESNR